MNLVKNSLKFTKQGMVKIVLEYAPEPLNTLKVAVMDSGLGFAPEENV
jgi:signal transduction histidine kinase